MGTEGKKYGGKLELDHARGKLETASSSRMMWTLTMRFNEDFSGGFVSRRKSAPWT